MNEFQLKSIAEYLSANNRFFLPRKLRFPESFLRRVEEATQLVAKEVHERQAKDIAQAENLNAALASFLANLLSFVDRSFVIKLVKNYNDETVKRVG